MSIDYHNKYLKYKLKFLNLRKQNDELNQNKFQQGGSWSSWIPSLPFMSQPPAQPVYNCPSKEPIQEIIVQERCCNKATQFPSRMANCEDKSHTAAAILATGASFIIEQNSSLDGIVEVRNSTILAQEPVSSTIEYIAKDPYISDHDGIVLNVQYTNPEETHFNIISCNLEGLCRKKNERTLYDDRLRMLNTYFENIVKPGTIMVCQEIVLKKLAEERLPVVKASKTTNIDGEDEWVVRDVEMIDSIKISGNDILIKLKEINNNLDFISDTYTSGIYYDKSVWELVRTIPIRRLYNGTLHSKFSNAYLFKCNNNPECIFWVVNIHLKAFDPTSKEYNLDYGQQYFSAFSGGETYINQAHIIELENIITELVTKSGLLHFTIPIYLCGDYNNNLQKHILVKKALERYTQNSSGVKYKITDRPMLSLTP